MADPLSLNAMSTEVDHDLMSDSSCRTIILAADEPVGTVNPLQQQVSGMDGIEYIHIENLNDLTAAGAFNDSKVWQLVALPGSITDIEESNSSVITSPHTVNLTAKPPHWTQLLLDCEKIGHYYRGWVATQEDMEIVLTLHKTQTRSIWGTRQCPQTARQSMRMMWKSQYCPFDGVPFVNCGSRAVSMECQFGPRRQGGTNKDTKRPQNSDYRQSCPARVYIKKLRKFPEFAIDPNLEKRLLKMEMRQAFNLLKSAGFDTGGQDRYYMQLPAESAHEYHKIEEDSTINNPFKRTFYVSESETYEGGSRLAPEVSVKLRELVSSGLHDTTTIRKKLRQFVERDLFMKEEIPNRHDLSFFPTVHDLQNHIHSAIKDIRNGSLALKGGIIDDKNDEPAHTNIGEHSNSTPISVTVTLNTDINNVQSIASVEAQMSDGRILVHNKLTADTARLLARTQPDMFSRIRSIDDMSDDEVEKLVTAIVISTSVDPATSTTSTSIDPIPHTISTQQTCITTAQQPHCALTTHTTTQQLHLALTEDATTHQSHHTLTTLTPTHNDTERSHENTNLLVCGGTIEVPSALNNFITIPADAATSSGLMLKMSDHVDDDPLPNISDEVCSQLH